MNDMPFVVYGGGRFMAAVEAHLVQRVLQLGEDEAEEDGEEHSEQKLQPGGVARAAAGNATAAHHHEGGEERREAVKAAAAVIGMRVLMRSTHLRRAKPKVVSEMLGEGRSMLGREFDATLSLAWRS